jgi:predicted TIM-barrel fold metal-dependent hydrolase
MLDGVTPVPPDFAARYRERGYWEAGVRRETCGRPASPDDEVYLVDEDNLAARFPSLTIIAAHPGWPWTGEMTAVALHTGNVYWELSGWLGYDQSVLELVFHANAERVLGL